MGARGAEGAIRLWASLHLRCGYVKKTSRGRKEAVITFDEEPKPHGVDETPADEPHQPSAETPEDIPEGQAEPDSSEPGPGGLPTTPLDPPSAG